MADEEYERKMVYAGDREKLAPEKPVVEVEKKERRMADWLLVLIAIIGLGLTVYYIGFEKITPISDLFPNMSNVTQPQTPPPENQTSPPTTGPNVSYGSIDSVTFTGNRTTFVSREEVNLSLKVGCTATCQALYLSVFDGSNRLASYESPSEWSNTTNVTVSIVVPRRANATLALVVLADSRNPNNTLSGASTEAMNTFNFNVLENLQKIIYGKEFYLEVNELGNLTDLNATIRLDSIQDGMAHISVINKDSVTFSSNLNPATKPNATFFDFLTIQILNLSSEEAKLIAWPNGFLEAISIQYPLSTNISTTEVFGVYLKCTGTCAGTYVGVHIIYQSNITRVGFLNQTSAWSGFEVVNISTNIPLSYVNKTSEIKILADTRNEKSTLFVDLWNPPDKTLNKNYYVQ